jgi:hypothetical protein
MGGGGGGGGGGGEEPESWLTAGVSVAAGPLPPLVVGSPPTAGAPGCLVDGADPIGLPAVRGAVFWVCPRRALTAAARPRAAGCAPATRSAAALRRAPAPFAESSAATDSVRRFF